MIPLYFQNTPLKDTFIETFEETPLSTAILTYLGYAVLVVIGHIRDFLRSFGIEKIKSCTEPKLQVQYIWYT